MLAKIYKILFFLGLFFFPFNRYGGIAFLGEFKTESGALFLFAGFLFLLVNAIFTKRIIIPYRNLIFQLVIIFLSWCLITTIFNAPSVISNYFKSTSGINRFIRQYFALLISALIFFVLYINVLAKMEFREILFKIRKVFLYSLIVASIYGFLEILISVFGYMFFYPILKAFDYFPFLEADLHPGGRISAISYEPPFLAIYLITISGWMFSYILTSKKVTRFLPTLSILILTYFSGSRTALIVIFFQGFIFLIFLYQDIRFKKYVTNFAVGFLIVFSVLLVFKGEKLIQSVSVKIDSLDFRKNLTKNVSNQSRFGMQYAALQVFIENPITGVGFGQQAYHNRTHYPYWATRNNYEFKLFYKNKKEKAFPPGYNLYTRLLAETGVIGISLFLMIICFSVNEVRILMINAKNEEKTLLIIVLISLLGLYINWLQIDTFRIYGAWLCLAILIRMRYKSLKITNE
ncbi:O-antigen ligase family protein [Flavobacterium sp. 3-218]